MSFAIRGFHVSDLPALYRICLLTSDSGSDGSAKYRDHELVGHLYAGPYACLEPDLAFVLTKDAAPIGYVLGARDTTAFADRCEVDWFPPLRKRYPLLEPNDSGLDAHMTRALHRGHTVTHPESYPAHLHIDLLPAAQGQGWGRKMIDTLRARLRELDVPGVHLGVGAANANGVAFYRRYGFTELQAFPWGFQFGLRP